MMPTAAFGASACTVARSQAPHQSRQLPPCQSQDTGDDEVDHFQNLPHSIRRATWYTAQATIQATDAL